MDWSDRVPYDKFPGPFLVRGTGDEAESAIRVRVVPRDMPGGNSDLWPIESAMFGLSMSRLYDVVGDGNGFERRPLYELSGCLWATPGE